VAPATLASAHSPAPRSPQAITRRGPQARERRLQRQRPEKTSASTLATGAVRRRAWVSPPSAPLAFAALALKATACCLLKRGFRRVRMSIARLLDTWTVSRATNFSPTASSFICGRGALTVCISASASRPYAIHDKCAPSNPFRLLQPDMQVVLAPQIFEVK